MITYPYHINEPMFAPLELATHTPELMINLCRPCRKFFMEDFQCLENGLKATKPL